MRSSRKQTAMSRMCQAWDTKCMCRWLSQTTKISSSLYQWKNCGRIKSHRARSTSERSTRRQRCRVFSVIYQLARAHQITDLWRRKENAEFKPTLEVAANECSYGGNDWGENPPQFIDPSFLHIENQILGLESSTEMGIYWDKRSHVPDFSPYLQQSLATDFLSPDWEQTNIQEPHLPSDIAFMDDMSELQTSRAKVHGVQGAKACHRGLSGYGFAISSGWASTFFPH